MGLDMDGGAHPVSRCRLRYVLTLSAVRGIWATAA